MELHFLQGRVAQSGIGYFATSFAICLVCLPVAMLFARKVGLVDRPGERKKHSKDTPLVGGVCIFLALIVTLGVIESELINWTIYFWLCVVLVIGVVDDYLDISYTVRILVHVAVVAGIWLTDGLMVSVIGSVFGVDSVITFGLFSGLVFTVFAVVGAINSVNMIDGVDGLLCMLFIISLSSVLIVSSYFPVSEVSSYGIFKPVEIASVLGASSAFFLMNARVPGRRSAIVFLGDAGSTLLGFVLVYVLIDITHSADPLFSPVVAGWIIGVPLLDASAVIVRRALRGESAVKPGRDHIHHLLLDRGVSVNVVVLRLSLAQIVMIVFAVVVDKTSSIYSDVYLFWGFVLLVCLRVFVSNGQDELLHETNDVRSFDEYEVPATNTIANSKRREKKGSTAGRAVA